jgi:hypothetical protein
MAQNTKAVILTTGFPCTKDLISLAHSAPTQKIHRKCNLFIPVSVASIHGTGRNEAVPNENPFSQAMKT